MRQYHLYLVRHERLIQIIEICEVALLSEFARQKKPTA
jgi:hypothetical protein